MVIRLLELEHSKLSTAFVGTASFQGFLFTVLGVCQEQRMSTEIPSTTMGIISHGPGT